MGKRIAVVGAGALGGYVGGYFAQRGADVTLIDMWPENIAAIRKHGLVLDGVSDEERFSVTRARALHLTEVQALSREAPVDIAIVAVKSYDTEWATMLIRPYLAGGGYVVSLQNCLNEERIAAIVGWGKTVGVIASMISVDLHAPGQIRRTVPKGGDKHTVFRIGEVHGVITERVRELAALFSGIDSAKAVTNLWGERWSKLVQNGMRNGVSAATGLTSPQCDLRTPLRRYAIQLGAEAVRVAQALGYALEKIGGIEPQTLVSAAEGDAAALASIEQQWIARAEANPRADLQRPSMAQDIAKGRRTEIDFMNGYIVEKGRGLGIATPAHEKLVEAVHRIERGEVAPAPALLGG